jgi:hypothetical protein
MDTIRDYSMLIDGEGVAKGGVEELAVLQVLENGTTLRQAGAFHLGFSIAHPQYFGCPRGVRRGEVRPR